MVKGSINLPIRLYHNLPESSAEAFGSENVETPGARGSCPSSKFWWERWDSNPQETQGLSLPHMPTLLRSQKVAEGGGVEPRGFTLPWFSGPVANRLAAPSAAEEAGIEPAPVLPGLRVSNPLPYRSAILPVPKRGFEPPTTSLSDWHVYPLRHLG